MQIRARYRTYIFVCVLGQRKCATMRPRRRTAITVAFTVSRFCVTINDRIGEIVSFISMIRARFALDLSHETHASRYAGPVERFYG